MYFFIKLLCVCFLTLLLLVAELVVEHFTHCLTLLVVAWQTMYRFISLFISCVSLALSHNNSKALEQKVIARNNKSIIFNNTTKHLHILDGRWVTILYYVIFVEYVWMAPDECPRSNVQHCLFMCPMLWNNCRGLSNDDA